MKNSLICIAIALAIQANIPAQYQLKKTHQSNAHQTIQIEKEKLNPF